MEGVGCGGWRVWAAYIVHPESFRSNEQNAIAFARRNRPRVKRNDAFAFVCEYILFAINRVRVRVCIYIHS